MNILYLSLSYVPSRRASSIQVMKMCQAFAQAGHRVTLVTKQCAARQEPDVADDFAFYGVEPSFELVKIPRPEGRGGGLRFGWGQWRLLRHGRTSHNLVYSRDLWGGWLAVQQGYPVLFEAHGLPEGNVARMLMGQMLTAPAFRRLVTISQALADDFERTGLQPAHGEVVVAHDGAGAAGAGAAGAGAAGAGAAGAGAAGAGGIVQENDVSWVNGNGRVHIGYVGHLYPGKGTEIVSALAQRLAGPCFHVIGGTEKDIHAWQRTETPENLVFHGFISPPQLPTHYQKLDILLLPPQRQVYGFTGSQEISRWMSPMKLFEYMAAGKAIVCSDLPVLREVLRNERNALLVPPEDIDAWVTAVNRLIADPDLRQRLGQTAQQDLLQNYTWQARAQKVLDGL